LLCNHFLFSCIDLCFLKFLSIILLWNVIFGNISFLFDPKKGRKHLFYILFYSSERAKIV
jgi:hypothetical protein